MSPAVWAGSRKVHAQWRTSPHPIARRSALTLSAVQLADWHGPKNKTQKLDAHRKPNQTRREGRKAFLQNSGIGFSTQQRPGLLESRVRR